jgi:hypothetical protein
MAEMWPAQLPGYVMSDPKRSAEIAVYERLERSLPDGWVVFYSRPWWGLDERGREKDGEADFVVCHPNHGLLFLEVKGGRIRYDPTKAQWTSEDRYGISRKIKDPLNQARTCKHVVLSKLRQVEGWPSGMVTVRHGVVFPNALFAKNFLSAEANADLFCTSEIFNANLFEWVCLRLKIHDTTSSPSLLGNNGIASIRKLLASPAEFRPSLSYVLDNALTNITMLFNGFQLAVIAKAMTTPRMLVEGGAGTGKSLIGIEVCKRTADATHRAVYICRNPRLLEDLKTRTDGCESLDFLAWDSLQPGDLQTAKLVVVDECQDFDYSELDFLQSIIPANARQLYLMDANQAIYNNPREIAIRLGLEKETLSVNLRNSQPIGLLANHFYQGAVMHFEGPRESHIYFRDLATKAAVHATIATLVHLEKEGIRSDHVAILCASTEEKAQVKEELGPQLSSVYEVVTIQEFKGRERAVIILIASREMVRDTKWIYVALSRAMVRLFVFGPITASPLETALFASKATPL